VTIPDDLGKDSQSVAALQRRLANFEHDLLNLGTQVCCCHLSVLLYHITVNLCPGIM